MQYLEAYCTHFGLWQYIRLNTRVLSITREVDGSHIINYKAKEAHFPSEWKCDAVAICSGLHVTPNIPYIKGLENAPTVFHSSDFKTRAQFETDKTVMIIGCGETGADIAYLAATSPTRRILLCHRDGAHFAPKVCMVILLLSYELTNNVIRGIRVQYYSRFLGENQTPKSRAFQLT